MEKIRQETEERYRLIKGSQKFKVEFLGFYYFNRYSNKNNNNKEGNDLLKLKFKNPHLEYLENENNENVRKFKFERNEQRRDTSLSNKSNYFGMGDEQYSIMKKLPSSRSTATLLKGYNKRPISPAFK